jgi:hypothetical protein
MAFNRTLQHFTSSQELATQWASGQSYILDQLVLDNDKLYRCILAHTSGATFAGDSANWTLVNSLDSIAPTTTAGDIIVHNGTDNVRQGIGSDGQVLVADNTQPNKLKWATLQQGAKNYITYGTFENGATTGWSLFNTTLTSKIPTGSITAGAASITSFAVDSTTPIAGTYDLRVASSGALTAGQGFISDAFTIDREDQAKPLAFSFAYEAVSGTMDFSGTSNNTFAVYIYDVSGSAWIQPAGVYNLVQSSGVGIASGTFQTTATGTQYRIAVVCITATAGAVEMRFDSFQLGPQGTVQGAPVTNWQSVSGMTATGFGTPSVTSSFYRRVGDSYEYQVDITFGAAGTGPELNITLPPGVSIDVNKEPSAGIRTAIGDGVYRNTGSGAIQTGVVYYATGVTGNTVVTFYTTSVTVASGHTIGMNFRIPVSGLSSSVQMSNDTDTRVISAQAACTTAFVYNATTPINFETVIVDRAGAVSPSPTAWKFTAPVSGDYRISVILLNSVGAVSLNLFKNGSVFRQLMSVTTAAITSASTTITLNAGEYIDVRGSSSATLLAASGTNTISIERLSGPATIAASETVAAFASKTSGSHTSSGSWQDVASWSLRDSTHGSFNATTGVFTAPVSGRYLVTGHVAFLGAASGIRAVKIIKISSDTVIGQRQVGSSTLNAVVFSGYVQLSAGETVKIQAYQDSGGNLGYFTSGEDGTTISIVRVGN